MRRAVKLDGTMHVSPRFEVMNVGLTDSIMLMGHDGNLPLNDPQPVSSIRSMLGKMNSDTDSPLLRAMLEAYYGGNRDIWVMAVAPLDEYDPELENRDAAYYQAYRDRLDVAFDELRDLGIEEIVVPVDAPFNSTVDFLSPLLNYCVDRYVVEGRICLGFLGTRGAMTQADVDALSSDERLQNIGEAGKFVSVFVGDGSFTLSELPFTYSQSVAVTAATAASVLPLNRGLVHRQLPNVARLSSPELTSDQVETLAQAGLNPAVSTFRGRRGVPYEVVPASDNTLAPEGSDWWSLLQVRLAAKVSSEIRRLGRRRLGALSLSQFRQDVDSYLANLFSEDLIRDFEFDVWRSENDRHRLEVELVLRPYFGVRELNIGVLVAPEEDL